MEIRTIGNVSAGSRPAMDSGVVPQAVQNTASEQTAVQTARAVPQVADMTQMGAARKSADRADVRQQEKEGGRMADGGALAQQTLRQVRTNPEKTRPAESRVAQRQSEEAGSAAQAERGRQERMAGSEEARQAEKDRAQKLVDTLSESLASMQTALDFSVDEDLGRVVVKVVDPETQEVIKQIPSEEALALAKSLGKLTGMFVETRA